MYLLKTCVCIKNLFVQLSTFISILSHWTLLSYYLSTVPSVCACLPHTHTPTRIHPSLPGSCALRPSTSSSGSRPVQYHSQQNIPPRNTQAMVLQVLSQHFFCGSAHHACTFSSLSTCHLAKDCLSDLVSAGMELTFFLVAVFCV